MYKTLSYLISNPVQWLRMTFIKPRTIPDLFNKAALMHRNGVINCIDVYAFAHGSELAFRRIYNCYAPIIYSVSRRYLQSAHLAEALVQEVFTALWLRREKYLEPEEVKLFVFTMARAVAAKYLKKALEEVSKNRSKRLGCFHGRGS